VSEPEETNQSDHSEGVDFGWRVHQAIQDWTRAVDQKASITLTLAIVLATLAAHEILGPDGGLYDATGAKLWVIRAMGVTFTASVILAMSVVVPSLGWRRSKHTPTVGLIYFGDLRLRDSKEIAVDLEQLSDSGALSQLAAQLQVTSRIAWNKHQRLRLSLLALAVGAACLACARLLL
jgi:hypothetical protein